MKKLFIIFFFLPTLLKAQTNGTMEKTYTYLALGDSYTIGEAVLLKNNFPYQTVQLLRNKGYHFAAPEIIAKTGWTTDELEVGVADYKFSSKYDFVTLLIGVNNQYRGREVIEYKEQFERLLEKAIALAGGKASHVIIVSIPDYSVTPFAKSMDTEKITKQIDVFNSVAKALSIQYKTQYVEITEGSKEAKNDTELVAEDGLHPSAKEYAKWAEKVSKIVISLLK
jgi:lysophospholipase L1-like esterase